MCTPGLNNPVFHKLKEIDNNDIIDIRSVTTRETLLEVIDDFEIESNQEAKIFRGARLLMDFNNVAFSDDAKSSNPVPFRSSFLLSELIKHVLVR